MERNSKQSPEDVQARVAAYAAEGVGWDDLGVETYIRSNKIYNRLGDSALKLIDLIGGEEEYARYEDYLDRVGGPEHESISFRADMLKSYKDFQPAVSELSNEAKSYANIKDHPAYMGGGYFSTVFRVNHNGKEYAVRLPKDESISAEEVDNHLAAGVLGNDMPHVEKIVAASYEDSVTISEIMPGKGLDEEVTVEDMQSVTDEQLSELVDTLVEVNDRGMVFDPNPSNILYDQQEGFGIIDLYSSKIVRNRADIHNSGTVVGRMGPVFMRAGTKDYSKAASTEEYQNDHRQLIANQDVLKRYRDIVSSKLTGADKESALELLDEQIENMRRAVEEYSSPEWIADKVDKQNQVKDITDFGVF